jgi:hypothetical protein
MHDSVDPTLMAGSRRSRSYLLRVWQEEIESPWRAMLRNVITKQEYIFGDLEDMVAFLETGRDRVPPMPGQGP